MKLLLRVLFILIGIAPLTAANAGLIASEVVVVYDSAGAWNTGAYQSRAVCGYYCASRGIPDANKVGIDWSRPEYAITPADFITYIANPLKSYLQSTFGSDPNDPADDPVKCLVLCYGVPMTVNGNERACSVDSALTGTLQHHAMGAEPIPSYGGGGVSIPNPYCGFDPSPDPTQRTLPTDFGEFRASPCNFGTVLPPNFSIVRMFDSSHAIAGGDKGALYQGTLTGGAWQWTPIGDVAKQFIAFSVNDIYLPDQTLYPGCAYACDGGSGVIKTTDYGATWSTVLSGSNWFVNWPSIFGICFCDNANGWSVGSYYDISVYPPVLHYTIRCGPSLSTTVWDSVSGGNGLPSGFVPKSIAAVSASEAWVSGSGGIYHTTNSGGNWYPQVHNRRYGSDMGQ